MMMDAAELTNPIGVGSKKIVGSEGFGRTRVPVKEVEARETDGVSVVVSRSTERCSSFVNGKDVTRIVEASESASWHMIPNREQCDHSRQLPSIQKMSEQLLSGSSKSLLLTPKPEGAPLPRKVGRIAKSIGSCSKRQKILLVENSASLAVVDNTKDISDKVGHCPLKCPSPENCHLEKQKNINSKRSHKKSRGLLKRKYDSFPMKAGIANISSVAGGNNYTTGLQSQKSDVDDIMKLTDNLSLEELLEGNCKYPTLGNGNVKKAETMSENILDSVRKACSVIQLRTPVRPGNYPETDSCFEGKIDTCDLGSGTNKMNGDTEDSSIIEKSSANKDHGQNLTISRNLLDIPSHQPKAILERLVLPPSKNLDALLLDATKPVISSRNTPDTRLGKQPSLGASLPPFSWSHASSGQNRTNSDGVKSSTSRSSCQGRWSKVEITAANRGVLTNSFTDLESLTYDQNLVPSGKSNPSNVNKLWQSTYNLASCVVGSSSSAAYSYSSHVTLDHEQKNCGGNAGHSPRVLSAARTLYDLATLSSGQKDGVIRWRKKAPEKAIRACKSTSNGKVGETSVAPASVSAPNLLKTVDQIFPSKKRKVPIVENKRHQNDFNSISKGPMSWSSHKLSRSSASKSINDSSSETRHSTTNVTKQSSMMPPPDRVLDNTFNNQGKPSKLVPNDGNRGRDRLGS